MLMCLMNIYLSAAGENRHLLGEYQPATLPGISFLKQNIPGLAAYFDNLAVYFKTVWKPCKWYYRCK